MPAPDFVAGTGHLAYRLVVEAKNFSRHFVVLMQVCLPFCILFWSLIGRYFMIRLAVGEGERRGVLKWGRLTKM